MSFTPEELAARYDDPHLKADRIEISAERFEKGVERGDDGAWGVGALVRYDGRALFVREGELWLLPGGRLEPGESPEEGAKREVREETGIDVRIVDLCAVAEQTFVHEDTERTYEFYFATFLGEPCDSASNAVGTSDRTIDEVSWLSEVPENTFDRDLVTELVDAYV